MIYSSEGIGLYFVSIKDTFTQVCLVCYTSAIFKNLRLFPFFELVFMYFL